MEILKKSIIAFAVAGAITANAQADMQRAFRKSYTCEYNKKYDSAMVVIKNVYSETSYECNLRLGWLNYEAGKYGESVTYYKKAVALMPASVEALWGLVSPQAAMEKWSDLEKTYVEILKLDPKNALANYRLGTIYYYRKEYVKAKSFYDTALNLYPFDYDSMLMSAWTDYFLGKTSEAKTLFNKVLLNKPGDTSALEGLKLLK